MREVGASCSKYVGDDAVAFAKRSGKIRDKVPGRWLTVNPNSSFLLGHGG